MRRIGGIYEGFADLHRYFYVLQPDHVYHMDPASVARPGHYRGCGRSGRDQHPLFHYVKEDQSHPKGGTR